MSLAAARSVPTRLDESGTVLAALDVLNEDQTLDRYELLTPIGRGGMAVVWAARLRGTRGFSKIVAIKTMLPALSVDPRFESMFLAEANIASRIKHPNVCPILDVGEDRGILFIAMEWVDGDPLSTLLEACASTGKQLPYDVAAWIVAQAARGLLAAHELRSDAGGPQGVVHRDVSPQNILVTPEGLVQIVDFGIAKTAERSDHRTDTGFIKGKVSYLAPEQVEHGKLDARADLFSLGVVLYELTAGAHPFRGATDLATLLAISCSDPAPPPAADGYPEALRAVLERSLAKDREQRYRSMRELAADLEAFVAREGGGADRVAAFVGDVLRVRREERARILQQAVQAADARAGRPAPLPETTTTTEARVSEARIVERPRRSMMLLVAATACGIAAGALGVRASQREPSAVPAIVGRELASSSSSAPLDRSSGQGEPAASIAPSASPPASGTATTIEPTSPLARSVQVKAAPRPALSPAPSASSTAQAPSVMAPATTAPIFRRPGF